MKKYMKIFLIILLVLVIGVMLVTGYILFKKKNQSNLSNNISNQNNLQNNSNNAIPSEIQEIPEGYYSKANEQGTLVEFKYNTYENFSYEEHSKKLEKRAIVYLPYGYDESKQYEIFYLMHGGWSNETTTLGTPNRPSNFKNVIDNSIENGDFKPLIIVCPTYNNESSQDSSDFSLAMRLNRGFYNELLNDLIPSVEGTYSTFANSTSKEDLIASREHRGFGGFSMGSVATWRTFEHGLDYFKYFLPMSCGTSLDDENIWKSAENYDNNDYFVFIMTGTEDFAYSYVNDRVAKMRENKNFEENKNFIYRVKEGYTHGGVSANEYTYNGLKFFYNNSNVQNIQESNNDLVEVGTKENKGFIVDNTLHSEKQGDIHFSSYYPEGFNENGKYAIYFALPGWEGLYFQGVGTNLGESYPYEAQKYNKDMIVISLQLDDWGEESANDTIELVEYFLNKPFIDKSKVYISGYSGGGETLSIVLGKKPELFTSALYVSSQWDGNIEVLTDSKTPLYMVIGENDSYYGSEKTKNAYNSMVSSYKSKGLTEAEINNILVLDVKDHSYFTSRGYSDEHGSGMSFAYEENIMNWVFSKRK